MNVRKMKSQAGFSLIELMIVVAILGILATIAIPNFQKFQARARQSEAKTNLSAYYSAQKAFFSEWNIYPGNFAAAGFRPEGSPNYRITAVNNATTPNLLPGYGSGPGANAAGTAWNNCFRTNPGSCDAAAYGLAAGTVIFTESAMAAAPAGCAGAAAGTQATAGTFTACASAQFPGGAAVDTLRIDQNKDLRVVTNGI